MLYLTFLSVTDALNIIDTILILTQCLQRYNRGIGGGNSRRLSVYNVTTEGLEEATADELVHLIAPVEDDVCEMGSIVRVESPDDLVSDTTFIGYIVTCPPS